MPKHKNSNEPYCWEANNCPEEEREQCLIYQKGTGKECLFNKCPMRNCSLHADCMKCPWFARTSFIKNIGDTKILQSIWD